MYNKLHAACLQAKQKVTKEVNKLSLSRKQKQTPDLPLIPELPDLTQAPMPVITSTPRPLVPPPPSTQPIPAAEGKAPPEIDEIAMETNDILAATAAAAEAAVPPESNFFYAVQFYNYMTCTSFAGVSALQINNACCRIHVISAHCCWEAGRH